VDAAGNLLEANGVTKVFGATVALRDGTMSIRAGEIHALLGENGAGKSTLIKVLGGVYAADGGTITVDGLDVSQMTPDRAKGLGLAFIHQNPPVFPDLDVIDNVGLLLGFGRRAVIPRRRLRERAREALARVDLDVDPHGLVRSLTLAQRTKLALATALAGSSRLLFLDEPTASLTTTEAEDLFRLLRRLRDEGEGVVLVTHRLDEVLEHCERFTVLRDGTTVAVGSVSEVDRAEIVRAIVGRELAQRERPTGATVRDELVLTVTDLRSETVGPVSLAVARGEVVALTGGLEAGHLEVARALYGLIPIDRGSLRLEGEPYTPRRPADALDASIGFVPGERALGLADRLTVRENLFLNPSSQRWWLSPRRERMAARGLIEIHDIRPPDPSRPVSTLSGGNAQKVLLARTQRAKPRMLVLNEPTLGIDVGTRAQLYAQIHAACEAGVSTLLVSSDFEEVAAVAHRALVMRGGQVVRSLEGPEITVGAITTAAIGG
jgi:ribose transport system ATP-binding protein